MIINLTRASAEQKADGPIQWDEAEVVIPGCVFTLFIKEGALMIRVNAERPQRIKILPGHNEKLTITTEATPEGGIACE